MPEEQVSLNQPAAPGEGNDPSAAWAERQLGQSWQHRFFHGLIRTLGKRPAYHMMYLVTFWYVLLYPRIRRRTRFYLDRRFPQRTGFFRRFLDTFALVRNFGRTMVDLAMFGILGKDSLRATCPDADRLLEICRGEKGFVLLNAHCGCWQVGLSALGYMEKPVSIVMIPDPQAQKFLDKYHLHVIDPRSGLVGVVEMMQALRKGGIVGLMGDRIFGADEGSVKVQFLGGEIAVPIAGYRLASATGVPVVVLMAPRTAYAAYELRLIKVIDVPPGLGRKAQDYAPYARQFAEALEQFVEQYPWQFYNFFDLWNPEAKATEE